MIILFLQNNRKNMSKSTRKENRIKKHYKAPGLSLDEKCLVDEEEVYRSSADASRLHVHSRKNFYFKTAGQPAAQRIGNAHIKKYTEIRGQ